MIVGLTGSIASGKTVVTGILEELGVRVVDSDAVAREVTDRDARVWKKIRKMAGDGVFRADGSLNRPALAHRMFTDRVLKAKLERLLHPLIKRRLLEEIRKARSKSESLVVAVPLLFEAGFTRPFDEIWVTAAPEKLRIRRLVKRDSIDEKEARRRIRSQMPQSEKVKRADVVIMTDRPLPTLHLSLRRLTSFISHP